MGIERKVSIQRRWTDPQILHEVQITLDDKGVTIALPLDQFVAEIVAHVGNPALLMTTNQLRQRIAAAVDATVASMKAETARAM